MPAGGLLDGHEQTRPVVASGSEVDLSCEREEARVRAQVVVERVDFQPIHARGPQCHRLLQGGDSAVLVSDPEIGNDGGGGIGGLTLIAPLKLGEGGARLGGAAGAAVGVSE